MIRSVAIIGTGLMGGSLALALRNAQPDLDIIGVDQPGILEIALSRGIITSSRESATEAASVADVVVLATPLSTSERLLAEIGPHVRPGAVVHDVCSVKGSIATIAKSALSDEVLFVGGHPMTGSEKGGIRHADALLFENVTYILCPEVHGDKQLAAYGVFTDLLTSTGARLLEMDASTHDRIAARVSHLPQLLSVLMVNLASISRSKDRDLLDLAAGGFRDMTRIASSPFPMWRDILEENRTEVLDALDTFEKLLRDLREDLSVSDLDAIGERFRDAEQTRDFIPADRKGFLQPLADVYVFASDRPGALVGITGSLFDASLSIKDIELLRIRESTGGTFRLGFRTVEEATKAVKVLSEKGFSSYRL